MINHCYRAIFGEIIKRWILITPAHIEVDFSWAMLHSACQSFNHENLENYLKSCWQITNTSLQISESKIQPKTVIHICTAHIMHRFSYKLDRTMRVQKNTKKILLFAMARFVNSSTLEELRHLFVALSISCIAKKLYPEVQKYIGDLEKAINGEEEREYLAIDYLEDLNEELPNDLGDSLTYKSKFPFGKYFERELTNCQDFIDKVEETYSGRRDFEENSIYFLPKLPIFLSTHYMPICPLWTGLILCRLSTSEQNLMSKYSNAIIENWMRILEKIFLGNEIKMTPADFIRKVHEGIQGRIKASEFAFYPISSKIIRRVKNDFTDKSQIEEVWEKRKRKKKSYFNRYNISNKITKNIGKTRKTNFLQLKIHREIPKLQQTK